MAQVKPAGLGGIGDVNDDGDGGRPAARICTSMGELDCDRLYTKSMSVSRAAPRIEYARKE
jgi:hypothetical protein